ncbi:MAG: adenylate/guanylate cyclase domain-containing protein [Thermodesulfovibrionales bacterium]
MDKKTRNTIALTAITFSISILLLVSGALETFELKAYDLLSRSLNPSKSDGNIVIVEINQKSIDNLHINYGVEWPWPREFYAYMIDYLSESDAVFIDMIYSENSFYGSGDDKIFSESIKNSSNVYLPVFLSNKKELELSENDLIFLDKHSIKNAVAIHSTYKSAVTPIDELKNSVAGTGNVMIKPDIDGVYRKVPLFFGLKDRIVPNFVLGFLFSSNKASIKNKTLFIDNTSIPMKDNELLLKFYKAEDPFPSYSADFILASYQAVQEGREPGIKKDFFKGKKVLIGPTAAGLFDLKPTAVSAISTGVMVHATALDNLIHKEFIRPIHISVTILLIPLLCFVVCYFIIRHLSITANVIFLLTVMTITLGADALLFSSGAYLNITSPFASILLSAIVASVFSYATEGKERRFIKDTFSQYMDSKIVNHILQNPELIKPGGQRKKVTVFFTDIAGFTTMAEKLPPEQTAKILHTTLNAFSEVIVQNSGVIDKYIGDAIMAFWGAPLKTENDELNACRAALQCSRSLDAINESFRAEGLREISMRIGLNTGDAIVGNLGSDRLFDYTAIGDTVNLASRLEGANKVFKTRIIVSEDTLRNIKDTFLIRDLGLIEVKGKDLPVQIYELISEHNYTDGKQEELATAFQKGRELFMEQAWDSAIAVFDSILEVFPGDGPAEYYRKWCKELSGKSELTDGWDIIKMTEK